MRRTCACPSTVPPTAPSDFAGGDAWKLTSDQSGNPAIDANPAELFGVTGMSVDKAWQVSTGRPDVLIAVLDSGIQWNDPARWPTSRARCTSTAASCRCRATRAGHEAELPGSRTRSVRPRRRRRLQRRRLARDARVGDRNANGVIDPQDLIRAFSDATDADGNGYVDDIAGWNFLDDDNDPFDEVVRHGTGEAATRPRRPTTAATSARARAGMVLPIRSATASSRTRTSSRRRRLRGRQRRAGDPGGARHREQLVGRAAAIDYAVRERRAP
jgi:hypothetical protein